MSEAVEFVTKILWLLVISDNRAAPSAVNDDLDDDGDCGDDVVDDESLVMMVHRNSYCDAVVVALHSDVVGVVMLIGSDAVMLPVMNSTTTSKRVTMDCRCLLGGDVVDGSANGG